MSVKQLVFQNLKANLKHYYLYVFALIFSVALYFAFVTLQYDPALDETKGSVKGAASIRAASVLLVAIVAVFNFYANNIFVKRRGKEIGLLQLIGMTKSGIFRMLGAEIAALYFGSLAAGVFIGFSFSRFILIILLKITGVEAAAALRFSLPALYQTVIVFSAIYMFILFVNYAFIKRQTILSLFRVASSAEAKVKSMSIAETVIGLIGTALIVFGYVVSSKLFGGGFTTMTELFSAMVLILASVIIGTYLFYKGTVRLIFNIIRKRKAGHLTVNDVMSLSSLMFRMKSNALLLTVITTVSALAIGLLSLSYISYYSAEKTAANYVPNHFSISDKQDADAFKRALAENRIPYRETVIDVLLVHADLSRIVDSKLEGVTMDLREAIIPVISDQAVDHIDLTAGQTLFTGYNDLIRKFMPMNDSGQIVLQGQHEAIPLAYLGLKKEYLLSWYFTSGGLPTAIIDAEVFQRLKQDANPALQKEFSVYHGIDIVEEEHLEEADELFHRMGYSDNRANDSRLDLSREQKKRMGLIMFIVAFLGLTFLITSGCILYFKQMDESHSEKPSYTILRKLGFTQEDLLKGIRRKQVFNFGIPLVVGLVHSYFAVQSGWFLFGAELWTPMLTVMVFYTALYSIFGVLSVLHYKRVIRESL